jgi:hypothetical protein
MKRFNAGGACRTNVQYKVNANDNLNKIKSYVDDNAYIIINRLRQFGKSTTLNLLQKALEPMYAYIKISLEPFPESLFTEDNFCDADYFEQEDVGLSAETQSVTERFSSQTLGDFNLDHGYLLAFSNLIREEVKGRSEVIVKDKRTVIEVV